VYPHAFWPVIVISVATLLAGCGGKLAKTGCAAVTGVTCNGDMSIQYPCGKAEWKRIDCKEGRKGIRLAEKNRFKPARYVETKSGSTLTFPDGETIVYTNRE
jgi:hypothetical protein